MEKTKARSLPLSKRGLNFEMLMWIFTRLSALAMYALILFAILGALYMGARYQMNMADIMRWGFMPNSPHVVNTDVPEIEPWMTPFWKLTAIALLLVAVAHGIHGLVVVADDYIVSHRGRQIVRVISILLVLLFILTGAYVIWTA
jgi:succinate dehydrogenase hydrophobic anchor subunit